MTFGYYFSGKLIITNGNNDIKFQIKSSLNNDDIDNEDDYTNDGADNDNIVILVLIMTIRNEYNDIGADKSYVDYNDE